MTEKPVLEFALGTWHNTKPETDDIVRLDLSEENGQLLVGTHGSESGPWGTVPAIPCTSSPDSVELTGFHASYQRETEKTLLAANLKYGILVIQAYHTPTSGRLSYFTREFFSKKDTQIPDSAPPEVGEVEFMMESDRLKGADPPGPIDLSYYVGKWRNIYASTGTIFDFEIREKDGGHFFHPRGAGSPREWAPVRITPVSKGCGSDQGAGFFARYDFGFMEMELSANDNQGIIIIASYCIFKDGSGRANYFRREFFFKE